jgi:hypothetical protein
METEIWKDIPWMEWKYKASNLWNIKSIKYKMSNISKNMTWTKNCKWYLRVCIRWKNLSIHRLVMLTFIWYSELQVNHINHIKTDNRLENLEYCTQSENVKCSYLNWQTKKRPHLWKFWIYHPKHKNYINRVSLISY